jgi:hypothetical protein
MLPCLKVVLHAAAFLKNGVYAFLLVVFSFFCFVFCVRAPLGLGNVAIAAWWLLLSLFVRRFVGHAARFTTLIIENYNWLDVGVATTVCKLSTHCVTNCNCMG